MTGWNVRALRVWAAVWMAELLAIGIGVQAQDGNAGINQANTLVCGYFDTGTNLMYAVGAIVGLIGAVKVYIKWSHGDHETSKVATVLKSFFGL